MNAQPLQNRRAHARGFSLIELMIAVVVVAILAAIAYPSFMSSVRKSRRAEAFTALSAVQQAQERWRSNNPAYTDALTTAWPTGLGLAAASSGGLYAISVETAASTAGTGYKAVATAVSGKSQAADGNCGKLGVMLNQGTLLYAGSTASGTLADTDYTATHPCWSR